MSSTALSDAPLSTLARGAAHDLRNVLFVISAHCEHLLGSTGTADREDLETIREAADRAVALAGQIVACGRADVGPHATDVNAVIRGLEPMLRRLMGPHISLQLRLSPLAGSVTANPVQVEQIVMNLAVNARDAMPAGGPIVIATETRTMSGPGSGRPTQQVVVSVSDAGPGIDPAIQDRIFEPYFTTKGNGGTGVGLATVRAIAVLHGGHIEMTTSRETGTTMRVVLPCAGAGRADADEQTSQARRRVLVVGHEAGRHEDLRRRLTSEGYEVWTAASGREALDLCIPPLPGIDVIVTDIRLPDLDGAELAARVRAQCPDAGTILITSPSDDLRGIDPHRLQVVPRPCTTAALVDAVRASAPAAPAPADSTFGRA